MKNYYKNLLLFFGLLLSFSSFGQIVANDDNIIYFFDNGIAPPGIGGLTNNDSLNGTFFTFNQVIISLISSTHPEIQISPEGGLFIPSGLPLGNYVVVYQICEIANPNNCDNATAIIQVVDNAINANDDFTNFVDPVGIAFTNVLINDTLNGVPVIASQVNTTMVSTTHPGITLSGVDAIVAVGTPQGTYTLTYQICEITNPNNCDIATVTISVGGDSTIIANDDNFIITNANNPIPPPIEFFVTDNDTLNGSLVNINQVTLSLISTTNSGINIDFTGRVIVNELTPNGTYTLVYQICELTNPNNCDIATVTVTVNFCRTSTPVIDSITQPNCENNTGSVVISGLPEATGWNVVLITEIETRIFTGVSQTITFSELTAGFYSLTVSEQNDLSGNCSITITFQINEQLGISVAMNGTYSDFNNDGITNIGDTINYAFTITNDSCSTITDISLNNNLLNIVGNPILILSGEESNATNFTASYVINQNDITNGFVINSAAVFGTQNGTLISNDTLTTTPLNTSDGIKLNAFLDSNANGVQDNLEQNFTTGTFQYQINSGATTSLVSSNGMIYLYETNPANSYNLSYTINNNNNGDCQSQYTLGTSSYDNVTVASASGVTTYNFPVIASVCNDVEVYLYNIGIAPRPGFTYQNYIQYRNTGNQTIASGSITFTKDDLLTITSVSESTASLTATGFSYNFTNLAPNESRVIFVTMQIPTIPTVSLGQLLTNLASVTIPEDINSTNNNSTLTQTIVGSYDPNDKTEAHGGKIVHSTFSNNDYLTYTIRFENTGTAEAINIRVNDVLDAQLDQTSIRMVRSSHPYILERVNNNLNWKFDGVNLPPSVEGDAVTGHGYIVFQIKPKSGFAIGDIIPNTASIYFDFNPAIVTEPCITEFVSTLNTNKFALNDLRFYPNPTQNNLSIVNKTIIDNVSISSVLGQEMLSKNVNDLQTQIDLSSFAKGIYFVKVSANKQEKTIKIIKE